MMQDAFSTIQGVDLLQSEVVSLRIEGLMYLGKETKRDSTNLECGFKISMFLVRRCYLKILRLTSFGYLQRVFNKCLQCALKSNI